VQTNSAMNSFPIAAQCTAGCLRRILLSTLMAAFTCVAPCVTTAVHAQQPPLLQRLSEALDIVLGDLRHGGHDADMPDMEQVEVAVVAAVDPAENAAMKQNRQALEQRHARLLNAVTAWMHAVAAFTPEQRTKLAELTARRLAAQPAPNAMPQVNQGQAGQSMAPILYGGPQGIGRSLAMALVADTLKDVADDQQRQKLQTALQERSAYQRTTFAAYIAQLAGRRLYLTDQQAEKLTALVDQHLLAAGEKSWHPLYSSTPYAYFLPYESLWTCIPEDARKQVLNEAQTGYLAETQKLGDSLDQMHLSSSQTPEEWLRFVEEASQKLEPWLLAGYRARSQWYRESLQLSAEQSAALQLAALGAASHGLREWRDQCYTTIDQMEDHRQQFAGGNFSFGLSRPDMQSEQGSPSAIWQNAVAALDMQQQALALKDQRKERRRQADSLCVTALLDQELWLLPEQRETVRQLTLDTLPKQDPWDAYDYFRDLILFCYPVLLADPEVVKKSLSAEQAEVWQGTAQMFRYNKENRLVELNMQNQGQWNFQLNQ